MVQAINKLKNSFLKMQAWELFSLIIMPVLAGFFIPEKTIPIILPILNTFFFIVIIGWLYSIGIVFNDKLNKELRRDDILFRANTVYFLVYVVILFFDIASLQSKLFDESSFAIFFSMYFIFAVFHCFYFASRALVMYEIKRKVNFENHRKEFFLLIAFVIGVWLLQPRINKLVIIDVK